MIAELLAAGDGRSIEFYTKANRDTLSWATSERVVEEVTVYRNMLIAAAARCRDSLKARRQDDAE
jgi:hypothetical protein